MKYVLFTVIMFITPIPATTPSCYIGTWNYVGWEHFGIYYPDTIKREIVITSDSVIHLGDSYPYSEASGSQFMPCDSSYGPEGKFFFKGDSLIQNIFSSGGGVRNYYVRINTKIVSLNVHRNMPFIREEKVFNLKGQLVQKTDLSNRSKLTLKRDATGHDVLFVQQK